MKLLHVNVKMILIDTKEGKMRVEQQIRDGKNVNQVFRRSERRRSRKTQTCSYNFPVN